MGYAIAFVLGMICGLLLYDELKAIEWREHKATEHQRRIIQHEREERHRNGLH
jgi:hypothetical protein